MTTTDLHVGPGEIARIAAIRRYKILDVPRDGAFDAICELAAELCRVPIATVTIVDTDRIFLAAARGITYSDIPREPGLCASAVMQDDLYEIVDALKDPRTLNNSLVRGDLGLRFYAAAPIITVDGHRLGTVNVIDRKPRQLSATQQRLLKTLAGVVADKLELQLAAIRAVHRERRGFDRALASSHRFERQAEGLRASLHAEQVKLDTSLGRDLTLSSNELLNTILDAIAQAVPGLIGTTLTSSETEAGSQTTIVAGTGYGNTATEFQLDRKTGPVFDAITGVATHTPDLWADDRWPLLTIGHAVTAGSLRFLELLNVSGVAALPFPSSTPGQKILTAYLDGPAAQRTMHRLETFAPMLTSAIDHIHATRASAARSDGILEMVHSRAVIEQAKGLIMGIRQCGSDEAWRILQATSADQNIKLRHLAAALTSVPRVDESDQVAASARRAADRLRKALR